MKHEDQYEELDIKLDENGEIDLEYYYSKADRMRAEYVMELFHSAKTSVKALFHTVCEKLFCLPGHPSH